MKIKKHGTVKITDEGVSVEGFYFVEVGDGQSGAEAAIDWAIAQLKEAKGKEW